MRNIIQENFSPWLLRYGRKFSGVLFFVNLQWCPYRNHCEIDVIENNFKWLIMISSWLVLMLLWLLMITLVLRRHTTNELHTQVWSSFIIYLRNTGWSPYFIKVLPTGQFFSVILLKTLFTLFLVNAQHIHLLEKSTSLVIL